VSQGFREKLGAIHDRLIYGVTGAALQKAGDSAERNARARLRTADGEFNWFGLEPLGERAKRKARPTATYRAARRNLARLASWPGRRRYRNEPRFT
jgi:hypothetical protein